MTGSAQEYSWTEMMAILRCPACSGSFEFQEIAQHLPESREYGVLICGCSRYPVVDGIPIFMSGRVGSFEHTLGFVEYQGPTPEDLIRLIQAGRGLNALLHCIAFPLTFKRFNHLRFSRLWRNKLAREVFAFVRRLQLRRWCLARRDNLTAEDWLDVLYRKHSPVGGDMFSYFFYRHTQPRQLAALSLVSLIPTGKKPVLDLACGFGHLSHYLSEGPTSNYAIGMDRNFFQLWVSQYWISPKSRFVCADADRPLPFAGGTFDAIICSDAFHYFKLKEFVLQEFARCAPGAPVIVTGVGNKLVEPNEGLELEPGQYLGLCGDRGWRIFGEPELLQRYLHQEPIDLTAPGHPMDSEKWLYLVYPGTPLSLKFQNGHSPHTSWPHSVGRLGINPIYQIHRTDEGTWNLRFKFPSDHYAFENVMMVTFHPRAITLSDETYRQIQSNIRSPEVERLIERMVVIGQPQGYALM
jgi:SAM-dependent methyltransferase/uncharacterized protein YbaR (Trm112 family)